MNPSAAPAASTEVDLRIAGMSCASCGRRVEKAFLGLPGVTGATVNLAAERATVRTRMPVTFATLAAAVEKAGYTATLVPGDDPAPAQAALPDAWPVLASAVLTLPLVLPMLWQPFGIAWALDGWIMAGTGVAARQGILIKDTEALEVAHSVTAVAFDKTGTPTEGRPSLLACHPARDVAAQEVLRLAAALQATSDHPLARAVTAKARESRLDVPEARDARTLPGRGVEATVLGRRLVLGSTRLMNESGAAPGELLGQARALEAEGRTLAWLLRRDDDAAHVMDLRRTGHVVAMEAAGITLMHGDPRLVADALDVSRRTTSKIRQGLFWAFACNVLGIPLAALGLLSPVLAGAATAFSSVSVVVNALALRHWRGRATA